MELDEWKILRKRIDTRHTTSYVIPHFRTMFSIRKKLNQLASTKLQRLELLNHTISCIDLGISIVLLWIMMYYMVASLCLWFAYNTRHTSNAAYFFRLIPIYTHLKLILIDKKCISLEWKREKKKWRARVRDIHNQKHIIFRVNKTS